jgi:hypothetical protein
MTTEEFLRRHFSRMGARLRMTEAGGRQWAKIRIDIGRDRSGEFFDVRLDGWHRVYMNRERLARHAPQIAFLD